MPAVDPDRPIIVVVGNPIDGLTFHGPVLPNTPEIEALTDELHGQEWWYAPLVPVPAVVAATGPHKLHWESADTDTPGDQNADSAIIDPDCTSMYWSLGAPGARSDGRWTVELIGVNHGDEVALAGADFGSYPTEDDAKIVAQTHESANTAPEN